MRDHTQNELNRLVGVLKPYQGLRRRGTIEDMIEFFEHTADLGLRARAANLDDLFAEAAHALFSAVVEDLGTVVASQRLEIRLAGTDKEFLLFDWLKTLLYHFDADHLLFSRFEVKVGAEGLEGAAWGEPMDRSRHEMNHEVKAITLHGLKVEQSAEGWLAEVIVDI
jgi:SHS2 domain-containing protein